MRPQVEHKLLRFGPSEERSPRLTPTDSSSFVSFWRLFLPLNREYIHLMKVMLSRICGSPSSPVQKPHHQNPEKP